jgi:adenosine deaminase
MDWFERVPKVELHLHLEGAIPYPALWELIQKYGGDPSVPDVAALDRRFVFRDFPHFIDTWVWKNGFLREYADFTFLAEAVARDLAAQNIRYAEVFYSPGDFARHELRTQPLTAAIRAGLARVPGVEVALVADLIRDFGPEQAARTLAEVREVAGLGVLGVGIGGSEHAFPPEPFAAVFAEARRLGFRTSAHAGEAAGPESIWGAVRRLGVDRIGHGTRAVEDEALVDYLAEHALPVELCPISNVRTGVVPSITQHPARRLFERGIPLSINTDDPKMFGNSLAGEYRLLVDELGFSHDDIRALILSAIRTSWLPEERKGAMVEAFCRDEAWLGGWGE